MPLLHPLLPDTFAGSMAAAHCTPQLQQLQAAARPLPPLLKRIHSSSLNYSSGFILSKIVARNCKTTQGGASHIPLGSSADQRGGGWWRRRMPNANMMVVLIETQMWITLLYDVHPRSSRHTQARQASQKCRRMAHGGTLRRGRRAVQPASLLIAGPGDSPAVCRSYRRPQITVSAPN